MANSNLIQGIETKDGVKYIDYNSLANLPSFEGYTNDGGIMRIDTEAFKAKLAEADGTLSAEDIFNILSNNGENQIIAKYNGQYYINAEYLRAVQGNFSDILNVNDNFRVDNNGNVWMNGNINLGGNITWHDNGQVQVKYSAYEDGGEATWHNELQDNDIYAKYSYDGGVNWTSPVQIKGENGLSAYEIAIKNGYLGTEEQWINSLKGEKGDIGIIDVDQNILDLLNPDNTDGLFYNVDGQLYINSEYINTNALFAQSGLAIGGTPQNPNFQVDANGNVAMQGDIQLNGNITWGTDNTPVKAQYSSDGTSWGSTLTDNSIYVRYSYNGGQTWTDKMPLRGQDGTEITADEIFNKLTNGGKMQGLFTNPTAQADEKLYINAEYIQANTLSTNYVSFGNNLQSGGFCWARGKDSYGNITLGATLHGAPYDSTKNITDKEQINISDLQADNTDIGAWEPENTYHIICTNKGIRLTTPNYEGVSAQSAIGIFTSKIDIDTTNFTGTVAYSTSSDARVKNTITRDLSQYEDFFYDLQPCSYKYNYGTSDRLHTGFIAQDVERALVNNGLTPQDFAAYVRINATDSAEEELSLRYSEFIALNTHMIQKLSKRIDELEAEVAQLKSLQNL